MTQNIFLSHKQQQQKSPKNQLIQKKRKFWFSGHFEEEEERDDDNDDVTCTQHRSVHAAAVCQFCEFTATVIALIVSHHPSALMIKDLSFNKIPASFISLSQSNNLPLTFSPAQKKTKKLLSRKNLSSQLFNKDGNPYNSNIYIQRWMSFH